jgi:hypothetical protein
MPWWCGYSLVLPCHTVRTVMTLSQALESLPVPWLERGLDAEASVESCCVGLGRRFPPRSDRANLPFRMQLSGVYTIKSVGPVVTGRVAQGTLRSGQDVVFVPSMRRACVRAIEHHFKSIPEAGPGYNCGYRIDVNGTMSSVSVSVSFSVSFFFFRFFSFVFSFFFFFFFFF